MVSDSFIQELDTMSSFMKVAHSCTPEEIQERLSIISVYCVRAGEMLAEAKRELRRKKASEIATTIMAISKEQCLSAKVQNAMLESIAEEEAYIVDRCERLCAASAHMIDELRTQLSYEKEQLRLTKTGY